MPLIDALKGIASQLIVLHHLAFYGPMSDTALELAPDLISWLYDYARIAVQVFLVLAGFLAARSLAPDGLLVSGQALRLIWRRYLSLILPFLVALAFAIVAAALLRQFSSHEAIPLSPTLGQLLAHALLIHSIIGAESLSAGVWYVAIDFQLFVLLVVLLTLARSLAGTSARASYIAWSLLAGLTLASLFHFNRQSDLDAWGIYFFAAYGLGAFAYWASQRAWPWIVLLLTAGLLALLFDYRLRLAVALAIALLLAVANCRPLTSWPQNRLFDWLGRISYSVFLIHFPVCLIIGAIIHRLNAVSPAFNLFGMLLAWLLSIAAGAAFYRYVEKPVRTKI